MKNCLHFSERVSKETSFTDWLNNPMGVCDCLNSAEIKTQPRKWMCRIIRCHPLGWSCRCMCEWVFACVQILRGFFLPLPTCCYLTFPVYFSFSLSPEQHCLCVTHRNNLAIFSFFLLCRCHNLDYSLISNYLRPNFLELVCFSAN